MKVKITYQSGRTYGFAYMANAEVNGERAPGFGASVEEAKQRLLEKVDAIINPLEMPPPEEVEVKEYKEEELPCLFQ
jgi:hypothetical protein